MEEKKWMEQMARQTQIQQIRATNQYTEKFGLALSDEDTEMLVEERTQTLRLERRVEFGPGILPKIIYMFCDSAYINQADYRDTLIRLQGIFYLYKNETMDQITDDELLEFMKEQFEEVCFGDLDYLENTCLDLFAQAIRAGYSGYVQTGGKDAFEAVDIVQRWDHELYMEALKELC
ncbi:MAG: DUF6323 family protein [Lachnospiraceae bacterium]|nr:DUF6323 family protein [Lachnospiraceae bacterium]